MYKGCDFDYFSLACDGSKDVSDTVQLLIFLRNVDHDINVTEDLLAVVCNKVSEEGGNTIKLTL